MVDTTNLPENVQELKQIITRLKTDYEKKIDILFEEIEFWKKRLFGPKSERYVDESQGSLFNEAEAGYDESINEKNITKIEVKGHTRIKKKGRKKLPESLEREIVEIDLKPDEKICASGAKRKFMGWEISEKLDIKPPEVKVIQTKRAIYGCPDSYCVLCEDVEESPVITAAMPPQLLDKTILTPGLFSYLITSKYCDHLPYYRQEKIFSRYGIDISRQSMCRWTIEIYRKYEILKTLLWQELVSGPLIGIDETTLQVITEVGRSATTKSYLWAFRGGNPRAPTVFFKYRETRSAKFLLELLKDYSGYIQTDGYPGYDDLEVLKDIILIACWAHARRKFDEAAKASKNKGSAHEALSIIQKLYLIERKTKDCTPEDRKTARQKEAVPILEKLKKWLDTKQYQILPGGYTGKAINYTLKMWPKLIRYIEDGVIPIDNNGVENIIRPECLGKKNWLFSYTPSGAHASAFFYSLIETAKVNRLEPYWYLRYLFEKIVIAKGEEALRNLLPQYVDRTMMKEYKLPGKWV